MVLKRCETVWSGLKWFEMVPDACEYFRDSPDAGWCDFRKLPKTIKMWVCRQNVFRSNDVFMTVERQTAKTETTATSRRRYHVFIKKTLCAGFCQSNSRFVWKPAFLVFCTASSCHQEIMFWLETAEAGRSYFNQKMLLFQPKAPKRSSKGEWNLPWECM